MNKGHYRVTSFANGYEIFHGHFTSRYEALDYIRKLHAANIPLGAPSEEVNCALNGEIETFFANDNKFRWTQSMRDENYEWSEAFNVYVFISWVDLHIDDPKFDVGVFENAGEWLERHGASVRLSNVMKRCLPYSTIYTAAGFSNDELMKVRNMGRKSMDEFDAILTREGIQHNFGKEGD